MERSIGGCQQTKYKNTGVKHQQWKHSFSLKLLCTCYCSIHPFTFFISVWGEKVKKMLILATPPSHRSSPAYSLILVFSKVKDQFISKSVVSANSMLNFHNLCLYSALIARVNAILELQRNSRHWRRRQRDNAKRVTRADAIVARWCTHSRASTYVPCNAHGINLLPLAGSQTWP